MRTFASIIVGIAVLAVQGAFAQCGNPPSDALAYVSQHKVPNFNGEPPSWMEDTLLFVEDSGWRAVFQPGYVGH